MTKSGNRRKSAVSAWIRILGVLVMLSACALNPWAASYWRNDVINFHDVLLQYSLISAFLGIIIFGVGFYFSRWKTRRPRYLSLLLVSFSLIILSDRLILAFIGLPLWVHDMENHFRHRTDTVRSWGSRYGHKHIRTNSYGHHDDDFPMEKSNGEYRLLMLGDSITMGQGVDRNETFSNQLESLLSGSSVNSPPYRVINAGVQGYSTFQEFNTLKRSLIFEPDMVAVGFCMNDLQEPFMINRKFGGAGIDYHGVTQIFNPYLGYLLNETGYGRLIQSLRQRPEKADWCRDSETMDVMYICSQAREEPGVSEKWDMVLAYLEKIYGLAAARETDIVLLVFPHTFQFMNDNMKYPQKILMAHAEGHGVDVLDFTSVFEELISEGEEPVSRYFLDFDHYTVEGHSVVASGIYQYMADKGILTRPP